LKANGFLLDDPIGARHNGYGVCMAMVLLRAKDQYEMLVESKHWRRGTITCPALPCPVAARAKDRGQKAPEPVGTDTVALLSVLVLRGAQAGSIGLLDGAREDCRLVRRVPASTHQRRAMESGGKRCDASGPVALPKAALG
jgi:hypothetical protein